MAKKVQTKESISGRIKKTREDKGLTQKELAEKCHLKQGTISGIENGRFRASIRNAILLAEVLEVSASWILTGEESDPQSEQAKESELTSDQNIEIAIRGFRSNLHIFNNQMSRLSAESNQKYSLLLKLTRLLQTELYGLFPKQEEQPK